MATSTRVALLSQALAVALTAYPLKAQQSPAQDFIPDFLFQGSQLAGWTPAGQGDWRAENGVIIGTARAGGGAVLMSPTGYQDVAAFSRFRCTGSCDAGLLLRTERTPTGLKGILIGLRNDTVAPYRVTLDNNGRILTREIARAQGGGGGGGGGANQGAPVPPRPVARVDPADWNTIEVMLEANSIANHLNRLRGATAGGTAQEMAPRPPGSGSVVPQDTTRFAFGPVALYVGSGTVQFDDLALKDLTLLEVEPERTSSRFRVQQLNEFFYSWGADAADFDRDGNLDVVSGPFIYYGPEFRRRREYYLARVYNPGTEYVNDMINITGDFTGDGWPDVLSTERRPLVLCVNPQGEARRWDRYPVLPEICSEIAVKGNVDGDPQPEIVYVGADGRVAYGEPDPANPTGTWRVTKISEPVVAGCNTHGIGIGDINGDGRADIAQTNGWWEQPASGAERGNWVKHDAIFGTAATPLVNSGGGEIALYDFNGDGLTDAAAGKVAHWWGLAWYEQKRDAAGKISFVEHPLIGDFSTKNAGDVTFSQPHSGATLVDVDRDGVMDFVTGKRHWSHLDSPGDPDSQGEGVIYWYRTVRNRNAPGGVEFVPELIHNRSGVGSEVKVYDFNRDGASDLLTSGSRGTFIFWGVPGAR